MAILDDNFNDYFEPENTPDEKPKKETPEEREERELKEVTIDRRRNKKRIFLITLIVVLAGVLIFTVWSRYFHPYAVNSQAVGRITEVNNQGVLFKTYEGHMVSEKRITQNIVYNPDFDFTIQNDTVAQFARKLAGRGHKVRLYYNQYRGHLPWRGETSIIVTRIECLDSLASAGDSIPGM